MLISREIIVHRVILWEASDYNPDSGFCQIITSKSNRFDDHQNILLRPGKFLAGNQCIMIMYTVTELSTNEYCLQNELRNQLDGTKAPHYKLEMWSEPTSDVSVEPSSWYANVSASSPASRTLSRVPCCPTTVAAILAANAPIPFKSEMPRNIPYKIPDAYASPAPQVSTGTHGEGGIYTASPFTPM